MGGSHKEKLKHAWLFALDKKKYLIFRDISCNDLGERVAAIQTSNSRKYYSSRDQQTYSEEYKRQNVIQGYQLIFCVVNILTGCKPQRRWLLGFWVLLVYTSKCSRFIRTDDIQGDQLSFCVLITFWQLLIHFLALDTYWSIVWYLEIFLVMGGGKWSLIFGAHFKHSIRHENISAK